MKVMIAIPCMDTVKTDFCRCLLDLEKPDGTRVCFKQCSLVDEARNLLSLTAVQNDFDYVLWLDSDMTFAPDTLTRLLHTAHMTGADLVTGLYVKRVQPIKPVLFRTVRPPVQDENGKLVSGVESYMDYPRDDIFPIAGCGFGCCLTSVSMLRDLWRNGAPFTQFPWCGEDISFCYRAKLKGYDMVCNSSIRCGHIGSVVFTEDTYLQAKEVNENETDT